MRYPPIDNRQTNRSRANVVSFQQRQRGALENNYPGFEGKTIVFDDVVSLASAELVEIEDISRTTENDE